MKIARIIGIIAHFKRETEENKLYYEFAKEGCDEALSEQREKLGKDLRKA